MSETLNRRICILGAGVMGTGIAALAISKGFLVALVEPDESRREEALLTVKNAHRHMQLMERTPSPFSSEEIRVYSTPEEIKEAFSFRTVIEAVTEDLSVKQKALSAASRLRRPGMPLITNTSGIPIVELANAVDRPEDLVGIHFMNPPYIIDMVEVIRGAKTTSNVMQGVSSLLSELGRKYVVVADCPGFVTSRLLHPMINTAANLVGQGVATPDDIDRLMVGCLGHSVGPLRTADLIGIDNLVDSLKEMHDRLGDPVCDPSEVLIEMVKNGRCGKKSGLGFYDYRGMQ